MAKAITSFHSGDYLYELHDISLDNPSHVALTHLSGRAHLLELRRCTSRTHMKVALIVGDFCKFDEFDKFETFSTFEKHISHSADSLAVGRALQYLEKVQPKME